MYGTLFSPLDDRVIYLFLFVEGGESIRNVQSINKSNVIFILFWGGNYLKSQTIRTDPSNGENRVNRYFFSPVHVNISDYFF